MHNFSYSDAGLQLTKQFEGLRLEAYQDCAGIWTIGYGHTGRDVKPGRRVTALEAHQFSLWVHVDMKPVPGLVRRRAAEAAMFRGDASPVKA